MGSQLSGLLRGQGPDTAHVLLLLIFACLLIQERRAVDVTIMIIVVVTLSIEETH